MPSRRQFLVAGGAGVGLLVAWGVWPRNYAPNLAAAPGEHLFGAYLKIAEDGRVTLVVPQSESGQGSWTALAQVAADALGADWRQVGVEPAPLNPLYANALGAEALGLLAGVPDTAALQFVRRSALMLTAGSSSVRQFEEPVEEAAAAARALLMKAAAARWEVDWQACDTRAGFVVHAGQRLRFGELAAAAADEALPDRVPVRDPGVGRIRGASLPRLDAPGKVDGSARFAGDVRLPDMVFASVRAGPVGDTRLIRVDKAGADRVRGCLAVVEGPRWVAAVGTTWWAAERALDALAPRFVTDGPVVDSGSIERALTRAFDASGTRIADEGDLAGVFKDASLVTAEYRVGLGVHAALEPVTATAHAHGGGLELWLPTDAPFTARAAAAAASGLDPARVIVHAMPAGGSFGANLEPDAAAQAALLAVKLKRPVQLTWSRAETTRHDRFRPAAAARMAARLGGNGAIQGWQAKLAVPATGAELRGRLLPNDLFAEVAAFSGGDAYAVEGALPPYRLGAYAIDHHPAAIGVPTGHLRGGAHGYTAFFTESFMDELAHVAGAEAVSWRIGMLGGQPRLARCLSTAAALGGWDGGRAGSGQGIACHALRGSFVAVLAEAQVSGGTIKVGRLVAAVDCGRQINPDLVRSQVEGGLIFGMAQALGCATGFTRGLADARGFGDLGLPRLADTPDITVELIASEEAPGGVSEIAVPAVAPAIANAVMAAAGVRLRTLPLRLPT